MAVASLASGSTRTAANRLDVGDDPQLAIRSTDADVRLIEGDSSDVVIRAKVTSGILDTSYELRRRGDEIEVVGSCMSWLSPGCGVVVTVAVPPKLPVLVATDSADVTVDGLRDRVVTIATGSGDVRGGALHVQEFSASTDAGDIVATFDDQPFAFKARTKSGDVTARIPAGDIEYTARSVQDRRRAVGAEVGAGGEGHRAGRQRFRGHPTATMTSDERERENPRHEISCAGVPWGGRRDLNPRPPAPQAGALPTELHPPRVPGMHPARRGRV